MSFLIKIDAADSGTAAAKIQDVETQLGKTTAAADKTRSALTSTGAAGAQAGTVITRGAQEASSGVERLKALCDGLTTAIDHTKTSVEGTGRSMGDWATQMEREAKILERIQGPLREYKADLDALDSMLRKGTLTQSEYTAEMDRLIAKQGTMQGPKQQAPTAAVGSSIDVLGIGAGSAAIMASAAGAMAAEQMFARVVEGMHQMVDESIRATNAAQKFVDSGHDVSTVMREQLQVADSMHASYGTTIALYNKVVEGSEGVALSHREQLNLTQALGQAVQLSNKPVEEAAGLMSKFAFAMQTGTIQARELRTMMREVPVVADVWRTTFHATNAEIQDMVKVGKIQIADLVSSISGSADAIKDKYANISRTHEQVMSEFKERMAIANGNDGSEKLAPFLDTLLKVAERRNDLTGTVAGAVSIFITKLDDAKAAAERLNQADLHGVAQEIEKLNDPAEKAQLELTALNKAFGTGGIDIDQYNKELLKLQTTINHGVVPEGLKNSIAINDAKESLASLNVDIKQHAIGSEAARIKYDALMTTINDGRLPAAIKLWEERSGMTGALRDASDNLAGLNALYRSGKIDGNEYVDWLDELDGAYQRNASSAEKVSAGEIKMHAIRAGMIGPKNFGGLAVSLSVDQWDRHGVGGDVNPTAEREADQAETSRKVRSSYAGFQGANAPQQSGEWVELNKAMGDAFTIAEKLVEPLNTYQEAIEHITEAQHANLITQEQSNNLQHQAKKAYEDALDALDPVAKLIREVAKSEEAYGEGHRVLDAALASGGITLKQYNEQLDKQRALYLANSEAGKTFMGGMEAGWIKLKGEADAFGATIATTLLGDVDKLNATLVQAANGAQVSWRQFVDSALQGLEQVLLKALEVAAVTAVLNEISPGLGSAATSAGATGAAVGGANAVAPSGATARSAPGAYPTPPTLGSTSSAVTQQAPAPVIEIHNHYDESVPHAAMQSTKGRQIFQNIQRADNPAIRR